jgi:hypothetical protein
LNENMYACFLVAADAARMAVLCEIYMAYVFCM